MEYMLGCHGPWHSGPQTRLDFVSRLAKENIGHGPFQHAECPLTWAPADVNQGHFVLDTTPEICVYPLPLGMWFRNQWHQIAWKIFGNADSQGSPRTSRIRISI